MDANRLLYEHSLVGWRCFGTGPRAVVCFHGYGEKSQSFEFLGKIAGEQFSFYAVDLPFHGETLWNAPPMEAADLAEIVRQICPAKSFVLLGFSLGGRAALSLYEEKPEAVEKLVLLAPDGLRVNFWYWLATQTAPGRSLFRLTMRNPGWFFGMLKLFNALRLVNSSIFKFVKYYIGDRAMRDLLYERWISLRRLRPDLSRIKSLIRGQKTPTPIVYGKHDRIILPVVGERFRRGIEDQCEVIVIASGHQVLHEKHAEDILAVLQ